MSRIPYTIQDKIWQSGNIIEKKAQKELEEAHSYAFNKVCEVIDKEILINKKMMKLNERCISAMSNIEFTIWNLA